MDAVIFISYLPMFPEFTENPNPIYWSSAAQNFYQEGRIGVVPRLEAIQSLEQTRLGDNIRFRDQTGRLVPAIENLIPDRFQIGFLNTQRDLFSTGLEVYDIRAPKNAYYLTLATYVRDDGRIALVAVPSKGNTSINPEDEERRIARAIADQEGIGLGEEGTDTILERVGRIFHFIAR